MTQKIKFRGHDVEYKFVTGKVIDQGKYSETHVSGKGSGGEVSVHSKVQSTHDIWLQLPGGKETSVKLNTQDIPMRNGQVITAAFYTTRKLNGWICHSIYNHNSDETWYLPQFQIAGTFLGLSGAQLFQGFVFRFLQIIAIAIAGAVIAAVVFGMSPFTFAFLAFVAGVIYAYTKSKAWNEKVLRGYREDFKEILLYKRSEWLKSVDLSALA